MVAWLFDCPVWLAPLVGCTTNTAGWLENQLCSVVGWLPGWLENQFCSVGCLAKILFTVNRFGGDLLPHVLFPETDYTDSVSFFFVFC